MGEVLKVSADTFVATIICISLSEYVSLLVQAMFRSGCRVCGFVSKC